MFISFGIVFFILAKWGFPVITDMIERRSNFINESLDNAQKANEQLAEVKANSDAIISRANKEQGRILRTANDERDKIIADAKEKAKAAAQKEMDDVRGQIQQEKEEAIRDIRKQIALISMGVAEKVIRQDLAENPQKHDEIINQMIDEVMDNSKQ